MKLEDNLYYIAPVVFSFSPSTINHDMYIALGGQSGMIVTPLQGYVLIYCGQLGGGLPGEHLEGALIKCTL